jgi:hypothetical protein
VGFKPTIPVFERVKTVHASYGAATVIGPIIDLVLLHAVEKLWTAEDLNKVLKSLREGKRIRHAADSSEYYTHACI